MPTNSVLEDLQTKTKVIVKRAVKGAAAATFAASLVPLGSVGPVGADEARAVNMTHMESTVVDNMDGTWTYNFTVFNDSTGAFEYGVNWELPLFDFTDFNDDIISNVVLPNSDWNVELLSSTNNYQSDATQAYGGYTWDDYDPATDPFHLVEYDGTLYENPEYVVHFYTTPNDIGDGFFDATDPIFPFGDSRDFSFTSNYGPTNAPYTMSYIFDPPAAGDPPTPSFGVLSPNAPGFQTASGVPEPITGTLAAISGFALVGYTRRRRG